MTKPFMSFGKFEGKPIADMTTTYLMWMASQDHIRHKRPDTIAHVLEVLRGRFADFDTLTRELEQDAPPPEYWKEKRRARRLKENKRIAHALKSRVRADDVTDLV